MTSEKFIEKVLERTDCKKHKAFTGIPCFHIRPANSKFGYLAGICNNRAKRAGYNAPISESAVKLKKRPQHA
jgi:hypothetical protein